MQLSAGHTYVFHEQLRADVESLVELVAVTTSMIELQHAFTRCERGCTEVLFLSCKAEEPTWYFLLPIQLSMASQYTSVSAMLLATALSNQSSTASTSCTLSKAILAFLNAALVSAPPALHCACKQASMYCCWHVPQKTSSDFIMHCCWHAPQKTSSDFSHHCCWHALPKTSPDL